MLKKAYDPAASTNGSIELTGNLGDVMKESIHLAYTYAKSYMAKKEPDNAFLQKADLHLHVPEVNTKS